MQDVTIAEAKEHLEELVEKAARGEDVRISGARGTAVRLVSANDRPRGRPRIVFGTCKHLADISEERMLAPLGDEELAWLSGEKSS